MAAGTSCALSYFRSYFNPAGAAPFQNHSAGQIARHLYAVLSGYGTVRYLDAEERPRGLDADLFVGHFWNFLETCKGNRFRRKVAFYSVSDPERRRALLTRLATQFEVPLPAWDFPPAEFKHEETMETADLVLLVGNSFTLETFPARWRKKIRVLNYSVDQGLYSAESSARERNHFCYVATNCGLRKGFLDILQTWSGIRAGTATLHAIGNLEAPWDALLDRFNTGSIRHHGWVDSHSPRYAALLGQCRFAHIPTYEEGQMGSLLEAIFCGCVPITTRASGIDDRVLRHCVIVEPRNIERQKQAVLECLAWPDELYRTKQQQLVQAALRYQNWRAFAQGIELALAELGCARREVSA